MINQTFLASINEGEITFCLDYLKERKDDKTAIVLISGFSEPLCDMDYYMSKMAKYLYQQGNNVFQMDLFAHGDSTGNSEDITISKLMNSITDVINHIICNEFSSIILVSRGLMATLISDRFAEYDIIEKIIGVNPWYFPPDKSKEICKAIDNNCISFSTIQQGYCKELEELPQDMKDIINVYSELGVFNQNISQYFLRELLNFDYSKFEKVEKALYFETNKEKNDIAPWQVEEGYRKNLDYDAISLVNDAMWHYKTYKTINDSIKKVDYENTV